ncbi:MAG: hypothetical protein ABSG86_29280, partial [Thermoguttaceae bacterium]
RNALQTAVPWLPPFRGFHPTERRFTKQLRSDQDQYTVKLNAAEFYRSCGFVGEAIGLYQSPRGITLDCIPMTKVL